MTTLVDLTRHVDVFSPAGLGECRIDVVGAGAVGARIVFNLAKLGLTDIHVWDSALVKEEHRRNHPYRVSDTGRLKVEALAELVEQATRTRITAHNEDAVSERFGDVVFVAIDDINGLRTLWQKSLRNKMRTKLMIEARLADETGSIFTVNPIDREQVNEYQASLDESTCASVSGACVRTTASAEMASGTAVWQFIRWAAVKRGKEDELLTELPLEALENGATNIGRVPFGELGSRRVDVIGAGATGSRMVLSLASLGFDVHVWDFDAVESHNIANQAYRMDDIGRLKVEALEELVFEQTGRRITVHADRVDGTQELGEIVFVLTDTMASRKEIWNGALRSTTKTLVIETRMGAEAGRVYTVVPANRQQVKEYEATLYDDEVTEVSACGASISVGPTAEIVSGMAVWQLIRHLAEKKSAATDNELIFGLRPEYLLKRSF